MIRRLMLGAWLSLAACDDGPARVALPCDVRSSACQRSVFEATAASRLQRGARPPPVRIITRRELAEEYRAALAHAADQPESESDLALRQMQQGLALLALVPRDRSFDEAYVDHAVESIAAYYSSRSRSITIVADSAEDEYEATFTLAHEYVHALQDQREGLQALRDQFVTATDDDTALGALIEGEATWLSIVTYRAEVRGDAPQDIDVAAIFESSLAATLEDVESSSAPLISASELLPYALGGAGVAGRYLRHGASSIEPLFAAPPRTLAAWVDAPALRRIARDQLPEALDCDAPAPPDGYDVTLEDRLGLAGLLALRVALGQEAEQAYEASAGWRGDLARGYASPEDPDSVAIAWRIRLQSASAAERFAQELNEGAPALTATALDREVLIAAASDLGLLGDWPDVAHCPERDKSRARRTYDPLVALQRRLGIVR